MTSERLLLYHARGLYIFRSDNSTERYKHQDRQNSKRLNLRIRSLLQEGMQWGVARPKREKRKCCYLFVTNLLARLNSILKLVCKTVVKQ